MSCSLPTVEPMDEGDRRWLSWAPVVRFFVGGPLDGRAIEGPDSREGEAGPMGSSASWWHEGCLYEPEGELGDWIVYELQPEETLDRARRKYLAGEIDFEAFELAVDWALTAEARQA